MNHEIMRKISCLCSRLPVLDSNKFESEFYAVSVQYCVLTHCLTYNSKPMM